MFLGGELEPFPLALSLTSQGLDLMPRALIVFPGPCPVLRDPENEPGPLWHLLRRGPVAYLGALTPS